MTPLLSELPERLTGMRRLVAWLPIFALAAVFSYLLVLVGFPAATLLGAMVAGIVFGVGGTRLSVPKPVYTLAQGFAGVFIARSLTPSILIDVAVHWPLLIFMTALTLVSAFIVGWGLNRWGGVPKMPAILGSLPGMSGAMVIIAYERGIDGRVVALMQYTRLASVIVAVSLMSHFLPNMSGAAVAGDTGVTIGDWPAVVISMLLAASSLVAVRFRFLPAAAMLFPMLIGAVLESSGIFHIVLLDEAIALTFAVIGLEVGLKFTGASLSQLARMIPAILVSGLALLILGGLLAVLLRLIMPVDPLTALLSTAPGSTETVAIVAVAGDAEVSVVLAFQTVRMFVVVLFGPVIMQQLSRLPIWRS
ncbi:AbrB family transcriptional regulator [Rhizobium sp. ZW T2_16]|uniref:AbrB family transcriptional regulator n=1 Tax=Rhizobium sp. ZW T2_16 TaxID=3378083 RepID=UPI0038540501